MVKRSALLLWFFLLCPCLSWAQDAIFPMDQTIADIFEQYSAEIDEPIDYDSFYEDLMICARYPVNLNRATREELEQMPFLSDIQVENILSYVYQSGPLNSIYELQLIEGIDMTDIRRMIPFVVVGASEVSRDKIYLNDLLKHGKNELSLRFDKGVETREGYRFLPEEEGNAPEAIAGNYPGNSLYQSFRYRFHYRDRILAGITAEKDAGEQFWGSVHKGYDFYSFYAQLNDVGKFKTFVAGDFMANFGQGLVLHPEFGIGKTSYVLNVTPRRSGLMKYSSTGECNFFRGVGATLRLNKFDLTAFYSNKQIDGDTLNKTFPGILSSGYHRTMGELRTKHTVNQQIMGGNVTYTNMNLQAGVTAVHTLLDANLVPDKSVYNHFYFSGHEQTTGGAFYRIRWKKLNLFGESAMTGNGSMATLNGCFFNPLSKVSLVVLHRYYSPEYDTFYASSFSETSKVNDENGLYLGAAIRPFSKWKFAGYADSYRFPWPKYGIDEPSVGKDYLFQADFSGKRNIAMYWRFKFEEKQTNLSTTGVVMPVVVPIQKTSMRYNLTYSYGRIDFKNILEGNLSRLADRDWTYGVMALQDVSLHFDPLPLRIDIRYQFFDAVNYENRFYAYEKDILYAFSIPMYYGLGSRYYVNLQYEPTKHLTFWFKFAQTVYADERETMGSGNETISGNRKTDIRAMVRWEF